VKKPQAVAVISPQHPRTQGDQLLKCNDCGDSFPSNTELVQHLLWHNETKAMKIVRGPKKIGVAQPPEPVEVLIKCVICGGGFHKKGDMLAHVKVRHSRRGIYACMECNKRFQRALDLVDHSVIHDKEFMRRQSEDAIPDEEEESEAEEEEEEEAEEDEEEEEDEDDDMDYSSSNSSNIPGRRLSSRRPVSRGPVGKIYCTKCTQSFSNNKDFRIHWQSHSVSEERNYICPTCKEAFTQVEELNRHRQIKHPETKVYICNYPKCNIPFVHQLGLKRHQKDHHGAVK
jgi:DNA-directed RNA polymerase subunit RPC12/RpoP